MNDLKAKIARLGHIVCALCTLAGTVCLAVSATGLVGLASALLGIETPRPLIEAFTTTGITNHLLRLSFVVGGAGDRALFAVRSATLFVTQLFLAHFTVQTRRIVGALSNDNPFSPVAASMLRRSIWEVTLIAFWNIACAIILACVTLFVSYLIDYGCYLQERAHKMSRIQEDMILSFAEITENKSGQTGSHVRRVSEYTRVLARALGYGEEEVERMRLASMMHDIGKLLIPTDILEKPARLTPEEYAIIKLHTTYGGQLLANVDGDVMRLSRTIALDHHEHYDGHGYAAGKAGDEISREGRIVAVADVYDALTSRRSYKDAWDERAALDEIVRCAGTQFDPEVVDAFCASFDEIKRVRQTFRD